MDQNGDRPATKKDLAELQAQLVEAMQGVETRILKAFYDWAKSTDERLNDLASSDFMFRARMTVLEERVTDLERRLSIRTAPPGKV